MGVQDWVEMGCWTSGDGGGQDHRRHEVREMRVLFFKSIRSFLS